MLSQFKAFTSSKVGALLIGALLAAILYVFPEAKPIACGGGFSLPFLLKE